MAESVPGSGFEESGRGLRFVIPARKDFIPWVTVTVLLFGDSFAIWALLTGGPRWLLTWLAVWGSMTLWMLFPLLWTWVGHDVLEVDATSLRLKREIFGIGHTRQFAAERVTHLRVEPYNLPPLFQSRRERETIPQGMFVGPLTFEVDAKTVRFGGITEEQAKRIVQQIGERYPQYVQRVGQPEQGRAARYHIEEAGDHMRVVIPSRKKWSVALFLPTFMSLWLALKALSGEKTFWQSMSDASPISLLFAAAWIVMIVCALLLLLWTIAGREVLAVDTHSVRLRREIIGIGRSDRYPAAQVSNFRITFDDDSLPGLRQRFARLFEGPLTFDYGTHMVRFGGVDEAEATQIVQRIGERYPQYVTANPRQ